MNTIFKGDLQTDAGMFGVWDYQHFKDITSQKKWENYFLEDESISKQIKALKFVPVNIHADGAFGFEARIAEENEIARLTEREEKYLLVSSDTYLLKVDDLVCFSGIEYINKEIDADNVGKYNIGTGDFEVTAHLIDWTQEPGMQKSDLTPKKGALPDFVILFNKKSTASVKYRTDISTFEDE